MAAWFLLLLTILFCPAIANKLLNNTVYIDRPYAVEVVKEKIIYKDRWLDREGKPAFKTDGDILDGKFLFQKCHRGSDDEYAISNAKDNDYTEIRVWVEDKSVIMKGLK